MTVDSVLQTIKRFVPRSLFRRVQPYYHGLLALMGAVIYRFPARKMIVIGVTGTKGKSSTCEYLNAIFEAAGHTTVLISTIRIKIGDTSSPESRHMTMPGRLVIQRTLRRAVSKGCDVAIIEISSEGARQWRDRFLALNALIFTNLAPEHIESHGSFENYAATKLSIARRLENSPKRPRFIVANKDDAYGPKFLAAHVEYAVPFSLTDAEPFTASPLGGSFTFEGTTMAINFPGEFSIKNALAATMTARRFGISHDIIRHALASLSRIPGRAENVAEGHPFAVIVDYAHTPESLEELYRAYGNHRKICVLGGTGGGRDTWKRPRMGEVADRFCDHIILTDEDPYDEDPMQIIEGVQSGITKEVEVLLDRGRAIERAISLARPGDVVLITGKGSNTSICGKNGARIPWNDAGVAKDVLRKGF